MIISMYCKMTAMNAQRYRSCYMNLVILPYSVLNNRASCGLHWFGSIFDITYKKLTTTSRYM